MTSIQETYLHEVLTRVKLVRPRALVNVLLRGVFDILVRNHDRGVNFLHRYWADHKVCSRQVSLLLDFAIGF